MSSVQSRRSWTVYEEHSYFPPQQVKKSSVSMWSQKLPSDLKQFFLKEWLKHSLFTHQILLAYTSVNFPMTVFVFNGRTNYGYWAHAQSTAMQCRLRANRREDYFLLAYDQNQATLSVNDLKTEQDKAKKIVFAFLTLLIHFLLLISKSVDSLFYHWLIV